MQPHQCYKFVRYGINSREKKRKSLKGTLEVNVTERVTKKIKRGRCGSEWSMLRCVCEVVWNLSEYQRGKLTRRTYKAKFD